MSDTVVIAILTSLILLAVAAIVGILIALPLMLLWNWLMPSLFNLREIGFLEAYGLYFLSNILFKSSQSSNDKK